MKCCLDKSRSFRKSWMLAAATTSRGFGARLRHKQPQAAPPCVSVAPNFDNIAFAIVQPVDPCSDSLAELLPWRTARRGPDLYSLVTIRTTAAVPKQSSDEEKLLVESSAEVDLAGNVKTELQRKLLAACTGQDWFKGGGAFSVGDIERAPTQRGSQDHVKMQPGSVVVANFDLHGDPFSAGMLISDAAMGSGSVATMAVSWNANLVQGYGKIVELHRGAGGLVESADVAFEGVWSQDWNSAIKLHYATDTGFYANVQSDRLVSHASFRNIFLTTRLDYLRWEFAYLWPDAIGPEDVRFIDTATGQEVAARSGPHSIRDFLGEGTMQVEIKGRRVPVIDPMMVVTPRALNLTVASIFGVGALTMACGLCGGPTGVFFIAPVGVAIMAASAVVQASYKSLSVKERTRFMRDFNKDFNKVNF